MLGAKTESEEPTEPQGPQIRHILGKGVPGRVPHRRNRGLLMLYLIDPAESGIKELEDADPVVGWAISLPSSTSKRTVSNENYIANSVWRGLNDWVD